MFATRRVLQQSGWMAELVELRKIPKAKAAVEPSALTAKEAQKLPIGKIVVDYVRCLELIKSKACAGEFERFLSNTLTLICDFSSPFLPR